MATLSEAECTKDAHGGEGIRGLVETAAYSEPLNPPARPEDAGQRRSQDRLHGGPAEAALVRTEADNCEVVTGNSGGPVVGKDLQQQVHSHPAAPCFGCLS